MTNSDFTSRVVDFGHDRLHETQRSKFGDPLFVDGMAKYEKGILEQSTIDEIRSKISDVRTQNVSAYDPAGLESLDTYVLFGALLSDIKLTL